MKGLIVVAALALTGCAGLAGGSLIRKGEAEARIRIYNGAGYAINVVTFSRCQAMTMGLNRLAGGDTIEPGRGGWWTVGAGCWDVEVGSTTFTAQSERARIEVPVGTTYTLNYTGQTK